MTRIPHSRDALQAFRGGFVVGVLGDELTAEGAAKNRLAERASALEPQIDLCFEVVDDGKMVFCGLDDCLMLAQERKGALR